MSDSVRPHRQQPTRPRCPWDSPGKNTGVGCHFLFQCMKVKSESEVAQSCLTLSDPTDCSLPGSSSLPQWRGWSIRLRLSARSSGITAYSPFTPPHRPWSLAGRSVPRQEKLLVPMVLTPCPPPHPFKFNWTCLTKPPHASRYPILTSGLSNHLPLIQESKP